MSRRMIVGGLVLAAVTACSSGSTDGGARATATSAASGSSGASTSASGTSGASASSTSVSGEGTYSAGDPHVGVVINDITQIFPSSLAWRDGMLRIVGEPDAQGQFSAVTSGMKVTAESLDAPVRVAWLNATGVLDVTQLPACASACATVTAPAGARYVVVQAVNADRFEVMDGASIQVQLTKVNVSANQRGNLATSTAVPK